MAAEVTTLLTVLLIQRRNRPRLQNPSAIESIMIKTINKKTIFPALIYNKIEDKTDKE